MTCRYGGHCNRFYSVAEHSVLVADIMHTLFGKDCDLMEGLLHDGVEAYLSDVPKPFKQLLTDWSKLEDRFDLALRQHFRLPWIKTAECHLADQIALLIEARTLMPSKGTGPGWDLWTTDRARLEASRWTEDVKCLTPIEAESLFLSEFLINDCST